ncbi:hypothetical protein [Mucilaginibacter pineti]|nr:hypothetical protein [Mucilaginibacter pineti]
MKQVIKIIIILFAIVLYTHDYLNAQTKFKLDYDIKSNRNKPYKQSMEDSLFRELYVTIYYTYYNPTYMYNKVPVFTVLKVDIDWDGKVTWLGFSDSADSTFVKAWLTKPKHHDDKATFERYAKVKSYKSVSLLIPVAYETDLPNSNKYYTNDYLESYFKFDKKAFTGNAIMLSPIIIPILTTGNE